MTSQYKICNNCGEKVDADYKFCPNCKSQSFRDSAVEVMKKSGKPGVLHALLYWNYDGQYVIAKSKVSAIVVFVFFLSYTISLNWTTAVLGSLAFTLPVFLVGYLIHYFSGRPADAVVENNDYGVLEDLKHFFFYWQNRNTGEFVLSKTKIISILVFIIFFLSDIIVPESNLFSMFVIGFLFSIPAYVVGFIIHRLTNPNPTNHPKVESKRTEKINDNEKVIEKPKAPKLEKTLIPAFENYKVKINSLQVEYNAKDEVARELIEKRFQPPQMTYTRFIGLVDKSKKLFDKEAENALTIINLATEDSPRVDDEIKSKIKILKEIISKMDDLTNELVLTMDSSDDEDVDVLIDDMENMIGTIRDYK